MNQNIDPNERGNKLDGLLDSALAQYGAAEPLREIEERVLGRLGEDRLREASASRAWWMWGRVAAAALATLVVAVMLLTPKAEQKPATPNANVQPRQVTPKQPATTARVANAQPRNLQPRNIQPRNQGQAPVVMSVMNGPRRAVFPTPTPPTDQEILLARYMRVTPREEVLAQINRKQLEFYEDPLSAPTGGGATSPHKADGTK